MYTIVFIHFSWILHNYHIKVVQNPFILPKFPQSSLFLRNEEEEKRFYDKFLDILFHLLILYPTIFFISMNSNFSLSSGRYPDMSIYVMRINLQWGYTDYMNILATKFFHKLICWWWLSTICGGAILSSFGRLTLICGEGRDTWIHTLTGGKPSVDSWTCECADICAWSLAH